MLYFLPLLIKNAWNVNILATRPRQSAGSRLDKIPTIPTAYLKRHEYSWMDADEWSGDVGRAAYYSTIQVIELFQVNQTTN